MDIMDKKEVVIVSAVRTPIGSFGGKLRDIPATRLGAVAIQGAVEKAGITADQVDEVYMGNVVQANVGQAPARQAAIFAGLPDHVCCTTVNKVCSSGMKSIMFAAQAIALGDDQIVVAGGMESMSNAPFYAEATRWGHKYGDVRLTDGLAKDGLSDPFKENYPMGNAAELCASQYAISRQQQDDFAIQSYRRSQEAINSGKFKEEIVSVPVPQRKGDPIIVDQDEEPFNVKFDKIPTLKSAFKKDGSVTAANASTLNDGAAALVLMSADKARELNLKPLARILGYADAEQASEWFTTSPSLALPRAISRAGLTKDDIDYFEINEAFSVVGVVNIQKLELDAGRVNVNGGAVSLGHPLGCSGARIVVTLLNVLKQNGGKRGAAGICNGGGGASAIVVELV